MSEARLPIPCYSQATLNLSCWHTVFTRFFLKLSQTYYRRKKNESVFLHFFFLLMFSSAGQQRPNNNLLLVVVSVLQHQAANYWVGHTSPVWKIWNKCCDGTIWSDSHPANSTSCGPDWQMGAKTFLCCLLQVTAYNGGVQLTPSNSNIPTLLERDSYG